MLVTVDIEIHSPCINLVRMRYVGISGVYVVDNKRNLKGYVTADDTAEALRNEVRSLDMILTNDIPRVDKDTPMHDIFNIIHDSPIPVAVVEDGKLFGIIVRGAVIAALSEDGEVNLSND